MPVVQISLVSGRSEEQLNTLIRDVSAAVSAAVDAPLDTVKVIVTEIPPTRWGSGGVTISEKRAAATPPSPNEGKHNG